MGLCFNSGPSWENESLNQIQIYSIEENAIDMFIERRLFLEPFKHKLYFFPNTVSANTGPHTE